MESIELKCRLIDNEQFPVTLTRQMITLLSEPRLNIEVKQGKITEDVYQLLLTYGYDNISRTVMDGGWVQIRAAKHAKKG